MDTPVYLSTHQWRPLPKAGERAHQTFFNPADKTYCALGLYFKAQGVSDIALAECGFPEDLESRFGVELPENIRNVAAPIMEASDEEADRAAARDTISKLFRLVGVDAQWTL